MEQDNNARKWIGRFIGAAVFLAAIAVLIMVVQETNQYPSTDDANVRANIDMAPEVNGRIIELAIKDNSLVKKGDVLFLIDARPYSTHCRRLFPIRKRWTSRLWTRGRIAAEGSAVEAAQAAYDRSGTSVKTAATAVDAAKAAVTRRASRGGQCGVAANARQKQSGPH